MDSNTATVSSPSLPSTKNEIRSSLAGSHVSDAPEHVERVPNTIFISISISRPVTRMSQEMDDLAKLRFTRAHTDTHSLLHLRELERMQEAFEAMRSGILSFSKYVPLAVVQILLERHREAVLGLSPVDTSVCFMDVVGFTTATHLFGAEKVNTVLTECFQVATAVITESGGIVDKYMGDSVMAFWSTPERTIENHATAAVRACVLCLQLFHRMRKSWRERGLPVIRFCVGVSTGECLMGNVGCTSRLNYTVMGGPVNLAARLEKLNRTLSTSMLVDEEVYNRTKTEIPYSLVGQETVRGWENLVSVYTPVLTLNGTGHRERNRDKQIQTIPPPESD